MPHPRARSRRLLALGLVALLPAVLAGAQARRVAGGVRPVGAAVASRASVSVVHDGRGFVTVVGEQASIREVLRILSRWFELPSIDLNAIPETALAIRFEQVPVAKVVEDLLVSVGRTGVHVPSRPRRLAPARPTSSLMMVHDGHGSVTVAGERASTREVLTLLSRWFDFPIVNPETIPDIRRSMQFERLPVAHLVDRLLHGTSINYLILADPETLVPSKVAAAPLQQVAPRAAPGPQGRAVAVPPAYGAPQPMPASPNEPASPTEMWPPASPNPPMYPVDGSAPGPLPPAQPPSAYPYDPTLMPQDPRQGPPPQGVTPPGATVAPGTAKPGMVVPGPAQPGTPPIKPPGR